MPDLQYALIRIALLWSAGIGISSFYRHIAPLERKAKGGEILPLRGDRWIFNG